jgi:GDP-L-fucose synthase
VAILGNSHISSLSGSRIFVAGVGTPVGAALAARLAATDGVTVCGADVPEATLRNRAALEPTFVELRPTHVVVAAGRSGGIAANRRTPVDLMVDNLDVIGAVLPAAHRAGVESLLYLASSCTYPRASAQPMHPDSLFTGPLEPTSEAYATAKLAGMVMCRAYQDQHHVRFVTGIAGDVYGPGDDFDPEHSHVVAGMIRRMHEARLRNKRSFVVWGTGRQVRDLTYVDDLADACATALARHDGRDPINLSCGLGVTIAELAETVREVIGFAGELVFDTTRPDGAPMKVLDSTALHSLGFSPGVPLRDGIERTYAWFLGHVAGETDRHDRTRATADHKVYA